MSRFIGKLPTSEDWIELCQRNRELMELNKKLFELADMQSAELRVRRHRLDHSMYYVETPDERKNIEEKNKRLLKIIRKAFDRLHDYSEWNHSSALEDVHNILEFGLMHQTQQKDNAV